MNNLNYNKPKLYEKNQTIIYLFDTFVIKKNKKIKKYNINENKNKKYYINEINILKHLKHINICNLINYEIHDSVYYLKLERCDYNLRNYIENNCDTYNNEICSGIITGLNYLYQNNIVHRDLKPENILIVNNNSKICDFGLSKVLEHTTHYMKTICGTPLYMAPEIIINKTYNNKIDLWSLGIIFFEIFFHKYPYKGNTHNELLTNIQSTSVTIPKNNISTTIINLITKLITNKIENRLSFHELFNKVYFINDISLSFDDLFDEIETSNTDYDCDSDYIFNETLNNDQNEIKIINTPNDNNFIIHRTLSNSEFDNFNNKDKINKTVK
tara:strand:+ start:4558 stop:5541 length:984 start_codon:yes stop_codon:yes gene_type:complete